MDSDDDIDLLVAEHQKRRMAAKKKKNDDGLDRLVQKVLAGKASKHADLAVKKAESVSSHGSDSNDEAMLEAVLAGHGLPPFNEVPRTSGAPNGGAKNENIKNTDDSDGEELILEAITNLANPIMQFTSSKKHQEQEQQQHQQQQQHKTERSVHGVVDASATNTATATTAAVDAHAQLVTSPPHTLKSEGDTPSPTPAKEEADDEKQVLAAILQAIHGNQSSVSGDLAHDEDDVEAVLRHAEEVAAASLCEDAARAGSVLHMHEHIDMRESLAKASGSVGGPSCICVHDADSSSSAPPPLSHRRPWICVGTTLGVVLFFDVGRKLCGMCGSVDAAAAKGPVVSLSLSADGTVVLAGHELGALTLWHVESLSLLREITNEYTVPITRLRHCHPDAFRAIVLDGVGAVRMLSFSRIVSKTVYRLTVVAAAVPEAPFSDVDVFFARGEDLHIVAAIAADTLLLSALHCGGLQNVVTPILRRTRPPTSAHAHELVQFVTASEDQTLLCVAWGIDVEIHCVASGGALCNMRRIAGVRLATPLHTMAPIAVGCLALLDQNNSIHLLDAGVGIVVESRNLRDVDPVVFSSRICGTRHIGAMAYSGAEVVVLGRRRVLTCTLLSWRTRLDGLVERHMYVEALELAKAFALEVALAVVGLSGDAVARRTSIASYLDGLLKAYLSNVIEGGERKTFSLGELKKNIKLIIHFCADIDAIHVFFGSAMEYLRRTSCEAFALYCLEDCILSGLVTLLPEMYIQPFFDLFLDEVKLAKWDKDTEESPTSHEKGENTPNIIIGGMLRAERALMRLESGYEILLRIAETHHLSRLTVAILSYRYNRYVDALLLALKCRKKDEGCPFVKNETEDRKPDISGNHDDDNNYNNGSDVALSLFENTMKGYAIIEDTELLEEQRRSAMRNIWAHFFLKPDDFMAILHINPERALSAALISLQDTGPSASWSNDTSKDSDNDSLSRRRCIALLFRLVVGIEVFSSPPETFKPWEVARRGWPPYSVVHQLFDGTVSLFLCGMPLCDSDTQFFCEHVCSHMVYQFQVSEDQMQRRSIQRSLAALFNNPITKIVNFSFAEDDLRQQHMARALGALYCSRFMYTDGIDCYLDKVSNRTDPGLANDVFPMIRDEMNRALLHMNTKENVQLLRDAVMHRISLLVNVDATSLAQFVFEYLPGNHEDVINALRNSSGTFLRYLDELVTKNDSNVANDVKLQNTYIELLCAQQPMRVYPYLHQNDSRVTYDLHLALKAVKRYKIADAAVFLLEKTLMIDEAMDILIDAVVEKVQVLRQEVVTHVLSLTETASTTPPLASMRRDESFLPSSQDCVWESEAPLQQVLDIGTHLCTKYNSTQDSDKNSKWFRLLELFTRPRRLLCDRQRQHIGLAQSGTYFTDGFEDNELEATIMLATRPSIDFPLILNPLSHRGVAFLEHMIALYTKYVSYLLTCMIKVLDLSQVVEKIVEDHGRERFGPFKPIIVDIMSSLSFELEVNQLCKLSIDSDIMSLGHALHRSFNNGVVPLSDVCYMCEGALSDVKGAETEKSVRIYACGHGYHESCIMRHGESDCVQCRNEQMMLRTFSTAKKKNTNMDEKSTKEENEKEMFYEDDIPLILRRLRQARAKIDGAREYHDILRSFLTPDTSSGKTAKLLKEATSKKLLLAPPPPVPITLGEFSEYSLDFKEALSVNLSDEDILELFGGQDEKCVGNNTADITQAGFEF